jgi:pimeloyl-ACP methyl ester carboxylesterase
MSACRGQNMNEESRRRETHGMADVALDVRLHYVDSGRGELTVVLLHGFPQTAHQWMKVIPMLVQSGLHIVAPDYRGAGWSSKPPSGYDKWTMAEDIHKLLREHLEKVGPLIVVGHDIGGILAAAYAFRYRDEVSHLVVIDAPLPGTSVFDRMRGDPRGWHAAFHSARDIAETLVQGRERPYLQHMIGARIFDPSSISPEDFDTYARAYEAPGAMRAAFELYRAFDEDARWLRTALAGNGKLRIPTLGVTGEMSGLAQTMAETMREIADRVDTVTVPRCGHWIPDENPTFLVDAFLKFVRGGSDDDADKHAGSVSGRRAASG